jgi:hypothetical protein
MPYTILIEPETRIAIATCTGELSLDDAKKGAVALWENPDWGGRVVVWDFRAAQLVITTPEIREVARFILRSQPSRPPERIACVTERDHDFGLLRMFEVFREHPATTLKVFRELEEAVAWARAG